MKKYHTTDHKIMITGKGVFIEREISALQAKRIKLLLECEEKYNDAVNALRKEKE